MPRFLVILLLASFSAFAGDYPNGTYTRGTVVEVMSFEYEYVRFVVDGTKGNGQPGTESFWIEMNKPGAKSQLATLLTAAASGGRVSVWHYGNSLSTGGQSGYTQGQVLYTP